MPPVTLGPLWRKWFKSAGPTLMILYQYEEKSDFNISPSLGQAHRGAMRLSYLLNSVTFAPSSSSSVTILLLFPSLASALDDLLHLFTLLLPSLLLLVNPEPNPVLGRPSA